MQAKPQRGFTLIEVMTTVAIIAVLAGIALPSYSAYVKRSKIPTALDNLSAYATRMEQRYQDSGNYANAAGTGCGAALPTVSNFTVTCALGTGATANQSFTATATGSGSMAGYTYTITSAGVRATPAHPKGPNTTCWTTKGTVCDT